MNLRWKNNIVISLIMVWVLLGFIVAPANAAKDIVRIHPAQVFVSEIVTVELAGFDFGSDIEIQVVEVRPDGTERNVGDVVKKAASSIPVTIGNIFGGPQKITATQGGETVTAFFTVLPQIVSVASPGSPGDGKLMVISGLPYLRIDDIDPDTGLPKTHKVFVSGQQSPTEINRGAIGGNGGVAKDAKNGLYGDPDSEKVEIPDVVWSSTSVSVIVKNPGGSEIARKDSAFTIHPKITIDPTVGTVNDLLTVTGRGFRSSASDKHENTTINFGGSTVSLIDANYTSNGRCAFTFRSPMRPNGGVTVRAVTSESSPDPTTTFLYSAFAEPEIVELNKSSGPPGEEVQVTGTGYDPNQDVGQLKIGDILLTAAAPHNVTADGIGTTLVGDNIFANNKGAFRVKFNIPDMVGSTTATYVVTPGAQTDFPSSFKVTGKVALNPDDPTVRIDETFTVDLRGFGKEEDVELKLGSYVVHTEKVDANGVDYGVVVPVNKPNILQPRGDLTVHARGKSTAQTSSDSKVQLRGRLTGLKRPGDAAFTTVGEITYDVGETIIIKGDGFNASEILEIAVDKNDNSALDGADVDTRLPVIIGGRVKPDGSFETSFRAINIGSGDAFRIIVRGQSSDQKVHSTELPAYTDVRVKIVGLLASVNPTSGPPGTLVTVTGTFVGTGTIKFDGTVVIPNIGGGVFYTETFTVPDHVAGTVNVTAEDSAGGNSSLQYTVKGGIVTVQGVTPGVEPGGSITVGTSITVRGRGFGNEQNVTIAFGNKSNIKTEKTNAVGTFTASFNADTQPYGAKKITVTGAGQTADSEHIRIHGSTSEESIKPTITPRITNVTPRFGTSNTPIVLSGDGMDANKEMLLGVSNGEATISGNKNSTGNGSFSLNIKLQAQYGDNTITVTGKDTGHSVATSDPNPTIFTDDPLDFTMNSAGALVEGAVDAINYSNGAAVNVTGTGPSGSSNDWVVFHGTGFTAGAVGLDLASTPLTGSVDADAKGSFYAAFQLKDVMSPVPSGGNKTLKAIGGAAEASVNFFVEPRITNVQVNDVGWQDIADTDHSEDNGRRLGDRKLRDVFVSEKVRVIGDGFTASKKANVTIGSQTRESGALAGGTLDMEFLMDAVQPFGDKNVSAVDQDSNKGFAWGGVKPRVIGRISKLWKIRGANDTEKKTLTDVRVGETLELGLDGFQPNQTITVKVGRADNFDVISTPVIESGNRTDSNGATTLKFKMPKRYSWFGNVTIAEWAVRVDGGKDENKELRSDLSFDTITGGYDTSNGKMRLDSIITKVEPTAGKAGDRVTIEGTGFGYIRPVKVYFHTKGRGVMPGGSDGTELEPFNPYPTPAEIANYIGYAEIESLSNGSFSANLFLPDRTLIPPTLTPPEDPFGRTQITVVDVTTNNNIEKRANYTTFVYSETTAGGRIDLEPISGEVTKEVTVVGSGYTANADVGNLTLGGGVLTVSDAGPGTVSGNRIRTDSSGAFVVKFNVPDIKRGAHDVKTSVVAPYEKGIFTVESKIWVSPDNDTIGTTVTATGRGLPASKNIGRLKFGGLIDLLDKDLIVSGVEGTVRAAADAPVDNLYKHDITTTSNGRFVVTFKTPSATSASSYSGKEVTVEDIGNVNHPAEFKNKPSISVSSNDIPGHPTEGRPGDTTFTITGKGYTAGGDLRVKGISVTSDVGTADGTTGAFTITTTLSDQTYGGKTVKVIDNNSGDINEEGEVPGVPFTIRGKVELEQPSGFVGDKFDVTARGFGDEKVDIYMGNTHLGTTDAAGGDGKITKEVELKDHPGGVVFIRCVGQSTHEEARANFRLDSKITMARGGGGTEGDVNVVFGESIKVEGKGFGASETVRITFGNKVNIATTTTGSNGSFSKLFNANSQTYGLKKISASSATASAELSVLNMRPKITVSPTSVKKDTLVTVRAWGFKNVDDLVIRFDGSEQKTGIAANSKGEFDAGSVFFTTPDFSSGEKLIEVFHASDTNAKATATVVLSKIDPDNPTANIILQTDKDGVTAKISDTITVTGGGYPTSTTIGTLMLDSVVDDRGSPRLLPVTTAGVGSVSGSVYIRTDEKGAFKVKFTMASGQDAEGGNRKSKQVFINNYSNKQSGVFDIAPTFSLSADEGPVGTSLTATGHGYISGDYEVHLDFEKSIPNRPGYTEKAKFKTTNGSFTKTFNAPEFDYDTHDVNAWFEYPAGNIVKVSDPFKILPTISVNPTSGGIGTPVSVTGKGFIGNTEVKINFGDTSGIITVPAQNVTPDGQFVASFNVDIQGAGSKEVKAEQAGVHSDHFPKASFTLGAGITDVDPKEGVKGVTVWVRGSGFPKDQNVSIQFGTAGTRVTVKARSNGDFEGSFAVPPQPYGTVTITARSGSISDTDTFTMKPKVERSPDKGKVGTTVSVTGWGFHPGSATVYFGGEQVRTATVNSIGTITSSFVVGSPDPVPFAPYDVVVTDAQNASASGGNFQVLPSITASKTSVVIDETITINGKGFEAGEEIWVHFEHQDPATENVRIVSEVLADGTFSGAEATVPSLPAGGHKLYVWGNRSAGNFITGVPGVPDERRPNVTVTTTSGFSITPLQGIVGSTVKVSGSGFAASTLVVVEVDGEAVTTGSTDALGNFTDITFTVPEKPYGTISIKVTVGSATPITQLFSIKPNITNVYPTQASLNDSVEVDGTGLGASEPLEVTLGTTVAPITSGGITQSNGTFTTTFRIPGGLTSTAPLAVKVRGKYTGATATSSAKITLTGGLISVTPTHGAVKTPVKVFGTHPASIANANVGHLTFGGQTITVANDGLTIVNGVGSLTGDEIVTNASGYYHAQFLVPVVPASEYYISIIGDSLPFMVETRLTGPAAVHVGEVVPLTGQGFIPGEVAQVTLDTLTPQTSPPADENGSFTVTFPALPIRPGGILQAQAIGDQGSQATTTVPIAARLTQLYVGTAGVTDAHVGDTVTIVGDGFAASTPVTVTVDGTDAVILSGGTTRSNGTLSTTNFKVPAVPGGARTVEVVTGSQTALDAITVLPQLTKVTPLEGGVGTELTIEGTGFGSSDAITVTFGPTDAPALTKTATAGTNGSFTSSFTLDEALPVEPLDITATGASGLADTYAQKFTYTGAPVIESVTATMTAPDGTAKTVGAVGDKVTVTVTQKDDQEVTAGRFSIGNAVVNQPLTKTSDKVWEGEYIVAEGVAVSGQPVTAQLQNAAGKWSPERASAETVTIDTKAEITSVKVNGRLTGNVAKKKDDIITVTAEGEANATSVKFSIVGVAGATNVSMTAPDATSTTYTGTYTVLETDKVDKATVTVTMTDALGNTDSKPAGATVTLDNVATITSVDAEPKVVKNGDTVTLKVVTEPKATVTADVSKLDTTQTTVTLHESPTEPGTFTKDVPISLANEANGPQTVTITVMDALGNTAVDDTLEIELQNELTFDLMLNKGLNMISIPLANATVDVEGEPVTISSVSDLGNALGNTWNLIISSVDGEFQTFTSTSSETAPANIDIDGDTGLIVMMKSDATLSLRGQAWPGDVTLSSGINIIGIPLKDEEITSVYDLDQKLGDAVNLIVSVDAGEFQTFVHKSPETVPSNIDIDGDTGLIVVMKVESTLTVTGEPWSSEPEAPAHRYTLINSSDITPVLAIDGMVVHEDTGVALDNISVTVRHLSSGTVTTDTIGTADAGQFSVTIVDLSHNRAAQVGDTFEISFRDRSGQFDLEPIRHVVTRTDVQNGRIALGDVIAYAIPSHSALLSN